MELFPILERRNKLNDNLWYVLSPTNNVQVGVPSNEVNSGGEVRLVFWSVAKADWLVLITCQKICLTSPPESKYIVLSPKKVLKFR